MRRGLLGSIAALAAGAGTAWGQASPPAPLGKPIGDAVTAPAVVPAGGAGPNPVIMPPMAVGPANDPLGLGPTASQGPPPGPMWPPPGPYAAPLFQPPPPYPTYGAYGQAPRFWFDGSYLLAFVSHQRVPYPLLNTGSPNQGGVLGLPTTIELIRAVDINYGAISGFRLQGGFYGDADRRFGAETGAIYTEQAGHSRLFSANVEAPFNPAGIPLLARPYIDTTLGPTSLVIGSPLFGPGSALLTTTTQLWGIHGGAVWNLYRSDPASKWFVSWDVSGGYRFLQLHEDFVFQTSTSLSQFDLVPVFRPGPFGPVQVGFRIEPLPFPVAGIVTQSPASVSVRDSFVATNRFNGGYFATTGTVRYGMFSLTAMGRVAIGNMHQVLEIQGATAFAQPSQNFNLPPFNQAGSAFGGLYANPTNIGKFRNDEFAVIPEFSIDLGINLTRSVSIFAGYNFLYINKVARPGSQLNPVIDGTTVPYNPNYGALGGTPGQTRLFVQDDFWLHAANFGLRIKY